MTHAAAPLLDESGMLRHLGPGEGPYPGRLYAGDPPTVRVLVELIPAEAWTSTGGGHLLAPRDLARTAPSGSGAGHTAVVTHCPHRLASWLREDATVGEIVTVVVSVLRAAQEARRAGVRAGTWWIDATGRPVLAPVLSPDVAAGASDAPDWSRTGADLLGRLAEIAPPEWSAEIDATAAVVRAQRDDAAVAACEDRMFALAAPAPLRMPGAEGLPRLERARGAWGEAPPEGLRSPAVGESWLGRFTDAEWARSVGDAIEGALVALRGLVARASSPWRARRARARVADDPPAVVAPHEAPRRGRAPWVVAAVVGAAVVAGGLMWPDGADPDGRASVREAGDDVSERGGPAATGAASVVPEAGTDPVAADRTAASSDLEDTARELLRGLATCGETTACDLLLESPAAGDGAKTLAAELGRGEPEGAWVEKAVVSLVDEYGGAAVLRVVSPDQITRMLVLVLVDAKWLVRDAYDVADQQ